MIEQATRIVLLAGLAATAVFALVVYLRTKRPSRRGSVAAMFPPIIIWTVFETGALYNWDINALRWISRIGVVAIFTSFLYQLWSIDYAEHTERLLGKPE